MTVPSSHWWQLSPAMRCVSPRSGGCAAWSGGSSSPVSRRGGPCSGCWQPSSCSGRPASPLGSIYFSSHRSLVGLLIGLGETALGFFVPDLLLYNQAQKRQMAIQDELADTIDQITVSVEAGLGFEAALSRAAKTGTGPLAEELTRTLQEMQVGVPRDQALRNLVDRTNVADLRHFVFALLQAQKHGVSVSQVLRVQTSRAAGEAASARRGEGDEDPGEDPLPAGDLHLPGHLHRAAGPGRHPDHAQPILGCSEE